MAASAGPDPARAPHRRQRFANLRPEIIVRGVIHEPSLCGQRVGVLGFIGAASAWTGMAMMSGAIYFEAVVQPGLVGHAPQLVDSFVGYEGMGAFLPLFLASVALFGLGFLLFGITMIRAGIMPAWAAGLLIVGSVIGGPQGLLPPVVAYGAMFALGIGLVGLAYRLWACVPKTGGEPIPLTHPSSAPNTSR